MPFLLKKKNYAAFSCTQYTLLHYVHTYEVTQHQTPLSYDPFSLTIASEKSIEIEVKPSNLLEKGVN